MSLAQDGPDGLEQALADAVSETSPGLVPDCLWGPVAEAAFAALGRSGEGTEAEHGLRADRFACGRGGVAAR